MYTTEELFEDNGAGYLHDVMLEATGKSYSESEIILIWNELPEHIQNIAHCWSLSDTVFRDEAFVYIKETI